MNATAQAIIDRLPAKPILEPTDIAAAFGMPDAARVIADIRRGRIIAVTVGRKFYVSRAEAARYVASTAYTADEA